MGPCSSYGPWNLYPPSMYQVSSNRWVESGHGGKCGLKSCQRTLVRGWASNPKPLDWQSSERTTTPRYLHNKWLIQNLTMNDFVLFLYSKKRVSRDLKLWQLIISLLFTNSFQYMEHVLKERKKKQFCILAVLDGRRRNLPKFTGQILRAWTHNINVRQHSRCFAKSCYMIYLLCSGGF